MGLSLTLGLNKQNWLLVYSRFSRHGQTDNATGINCRSFSISLCNNLITLTPKPSAQTLNNPKPSTQPLNEALVLPSHTSALLWPDLRASYYTLYYTTTLILYILYRTLFYYTILYYTILYYTILYYTILYYTILYYTILYYTMLCYAMLLYCGIPYGAILYSTVVYMNICRTKPSS